MRVLLISSPLGRKQGGLVFPIGLAYVATALEKHEITALDPNTAKKPFHEIQKAIKKTQPDVVGVSLRNVDTTQSWDVFSYFDAFVKAIKTIKEMQPSAKVIVGGPGFSMFANEIMERVPDIDYGVFLEGERAFPELLENPEHPQRVQGVFLRHGKDVLFTGLSKPLNFDELPAPKRDLPGLEPRRYKEVSYSMGVQTKRGCAFHCTYCTYPLLQGVCARCRAPKKIVDEIEQIKNLYDIGEIFFADTVFNYPPNHSREIVRELMARKLEVKWKAWYREDCMNKAFMIEAQKADCQLFEFSPDGGSQQALDMLQKGISITDVVRMYEIASQIDGIEVAFNFMYNVPGENPGTIGSLLKLLTNITVKCREKLKWLGLTKIRIYPNTGIHRIALRQGIVSPTDDLLYPVFYDPSPFNFLYSIALSSFDRKNILALLSGETAEKLVKAKHIKESI